MTTDDSTALNTIATNTAAVISPASSASSATTISIMPPGVCAMEIRSRFTRGTRANVTPSQAPR